jgi:hypothetical protein
MVLTPNDLFSWNNKYSKYTVIQLRPDRAGGDSGPSPAPAPPPCLIASTYIYVWLRERGGLWGYTHT